MADTTPPTRPARVLLAEVSDLFAANLCAARLEAEGIEVRIVCEAAGPYRLNIGPMAVARIWVDAEHLEEARLVLLEAEAEAAVAAADPRMERVEPDEAPLVSRAWLLAGALVVLGAFAIRYWLILT